MRLKSNKVVGALLLGVAFLLTCIPATAQQKPNWMRQSEASLNKKRSNDGYRLKVFHTHDVDMNKLHAGRLAGLLAFVGEQYGVSTNAMRVDSLRMGTDSVTTYRMTWENPTGESVVYARKIDEYCVYEDYADNSYEFEYYQLYAVAANNRTPDVFDEFELTRSYNGRATALSIIPGIGQLYKGQKAKGYTLLASEVALVTSAIVFNMKSRYCFDMMDEQPQFKNSWQSKARGWRNMRNISIGLAGGLYLYNLIDAAVSKGSARLVVKKPKATQVALVPMATEDGTGFSLVLKF
ncbi:DUF5683 domain-containing protein [Bacteroides sp. AN502(2024)]|uniref:DUF5683 domain-containing protein n=1 Tax=Bacteroides sp. AN502(2024) TaxID=3160599 RepID=UPI003518C721